MTMILLWLASLCSISSALLPDFDSRRGFLAQIPLLLGQKQIYSTATVRQKKKEQPPPHSAAKPSRTIVVPIEYAPELSAYIVRYRIGERLFAGILDTGSPFLTVPSYCEQIVWDSPKKWGCYDPKYDTSSERFAEPTFERFDNNEGRVEWRRTSNFAFWDEGSGTPTLWDEDASDTFQRLVFGILEGSLIGGSGGVFFGLIRDTDNYIRPSFLSQVGVQSFTIDFINNCLILTDQQITVPPTTPYIPLVADLRRYGDPTLHYTAKAANVMVNGGPLVFDNKPIYVIFDTGVTGMVVSLELWEDRYRVARANRERSLWGNVEIDFAPNSGQEAITLAAQSPLTTPLGQSPPWKGFKGHLIVIGLAFLDKKKFSIDIDNQILLLEV